VQSFEVDDGQTVYHAGDDSWGIMGQRVRIHHSFWGWEDDAYSECRVVGYVGKYTFPAGRTSKHTYVIKCDGYHYPATHSTVADALIDAATKRRIKKAPPPKVI
jgi:hypothetical protein